MFIVMVLLGIAGRAQGPKAPRIVNIVNFIRLLEPRDTAITEDVLYQTVVRQVALMRKCRLRGTFLVQYDALMDPRYQALLRSLPRDSCEIGGWWELPQPLVEKAGMRWRGRYPWDWRANIGFATGYSPAEREKLIDVYMKDFKTVFGYYPATVGSWFIDAHSLSYMETKYHIVASCNCKDQYGTDGYTLWAVTGIRLIIRARSILICLRSMPRSRYRCLYSGCWGAIRSGNTIMDWGVRDRG
jgi:hypothetical protein